MKLQASLVYHNALSGLETQSAILVKEYLERISLRKLGYVYDLGELTVIDADIHLYLASVFYDLEDQELKRKK